MFQLVRAALSPTQGASAARAARAPAGACLAVARGVRTGTAAARAAAIHSTNTYTCKARESRWVTLFFPGSMITRRLGSRGGALRI